MEEFIKDLKKMSFTFLLLVYMMLSSYFIVAQLKIDRSLWFSSQNACLISFVEAIGLAGLSFLSLSLAIIA